MRVHVLNKTRTTDGEGWRVGTYAEDYIIQGKCFSVTDVLTLNATTTYNYVFRCSDSHCSVINFPPAFSATGGPVIITIYGGTNYTGVNSLNVRNRNVLSTITPTCTLTDTGTGTFTGIQTSKYLVNAAHKVGGAELDNMPYVLDGINYLITVENQDSSAVQFGFKFVWFEV